jgi:hypothetical protein
MVSSSFLFPDPAVSRIPENAFSPRLLKMAQMQGGERKAE